MNKEDIKRQVVNLVREMCNNRYQTIENYTDTATKIMELIEQSNQVPVEEKEYEIVQVHYNHDEQCMYTKGEGRWWDREGSKHAISDDTVEHRLSRDEMQVYSVIRLSDCQQFTVGDKIVTSYNTNAIKPFVIDRIEESNTVAGGISLSQDGGSSVSIQIAKHYTEPVEEKVYEILSYKNREGVWIYNTALTQIDIYPNYCLNGNPDERMTGPYADTNPGEYTIHSVKRISDGEVFTVGDEIVHSNMIYSNNRPEGVFVIDNFQLGIHNDILANPVNEKEYCNIRYCKKVEEPVEMSIGEQKYTITPDMANVVNKYLQELITGIKEPIQEMVYAVYPDNNWELYETTKANAGDTSMSHGKWFTCPEDRQEYIEYNKECLSQKEVIEEVVAKTELARGVRASKEFIEIIKCALDTYVMNKLKQ